MLPRTQLLASFTQQAQQIAAGYAIAFIKTEYEAGQRRPFLIYYRLPLAEGYSQTAPAASMEGALENLRDALWQAMFENKIISPN